MKAENRIIGIGGSIFDKSRPAFATFWTNIAENGGVELSKLYFTGKSRERTEFGETVSEYEMVDDGGGTNYVSEVDLFQRRTTKKKS